MKNYEFGGSLKAMGTAINEKRERRGKQSC